MEKAVFSLEEVNNEKEFEALSLATFQFQYEENSVYRSFCDLLNISPVDVNSLTQIPHLPIQFFKSHEVRAVQGEATTCFSSSATSGQGTSKHFVQDISLYQKSFRKGFALQYGEVKQWAILALLPSYLEREGSSLVYMMDDLIGQSNHPASGFYLNDFQALQQQLGELEKAKQPTLLLGVSFALLDFAEQFPMQLEHTIVMETGGMKGRRKELVREELHACLQKGFGVETIHSEYGMTELLSQAYSKGNGVFNCPPWMKLSARDINDPLSPAAAGKIGRLNITDLANQESCAFIATDDLGRVYPDGSFKVLGRLDVSDIRGCNLMVY